MDECAYSNRLYVRDAVGSSPSDSILQSLTRRSISVAAMKVYVHDGDSCLGQAIFDAIQVRV